MKEFVKNTALEIIIGAVMVLATVMICAIFWKNDYKPEYELERYKYEQAQKALDSLQIEKTELLRSAALHVNSADSAMALMGAKGKEKLKLIKQYEKINTTIDNWTSSQLDSAFAVN